MLIQNILNSTTSRDITRDRPTHVAVLPQNYSVRFCLARRSCALMKFYAADDEIRYASEAHNVAADRKSRYCSRVRRRTRHSGETREVAQSRRRIVLQDAKSHGRCKGSAMKRESAHRKKKIVHFPSRREKKCVIAWRMWSLHREKQGNGKEKKRKMLRNRESTSETRGATRTRLNRVNSDVNYTRKSDRRAGPRRRAAARRGGTLNMQRAVK